jgi:hypothetical protein
MNMNYDYEEQDFEYRVDGNREREPIGRRGGNEQSSPRSRMNYSRTARPAVSHNGIHRRRNKRFAW